MNLIHLLEALFSTLYGTCVKSTAYFSRTFSRRRRSAAVTVDSGRSQHNPYAAAPGHSRTFVMLCIEVFLKKLVQTPRRGNVFAFAVIFLLVMTCLRMLLTTQKIHSTDLSFPIHKVAVEIEGTAHVDMRSRYISRNVKAIDSFPRKVVILTYERSGSTLMGEMLNQNEAVFYWFEPLHDSLFWLWNNGTLRSEDKDTEIIRNILNCRLQQLPIEIQLDMFILEQSKSQNLYKRCILRTEWKNSSVRSCRQFVTSAWPKRVKIKNSKDWIQSKIFRNIWRVFNHYKDALKRKSTDAIYDDFITNILQKYKSTGTLDLDTAVTHTFLYRLREFCASSVKPIIHRCIEQLEHTCHNASVRSIKTIRITMRAIEDLASSDPQLKVIHLVRDPRAVMQSRIQVYKHIVMKDGYPTNFDLQSASRNMCDTILKDVRKAHDLQTFNSVPVLRRKYEDMIEYYNNTLNDIYNFINITSSSRVQKWLYNTMNAKSDNGALGTARRNPLQHIDKWRDSLSKKAITEIDNSCKELYLFLGYKRLNSSK